MRLGVLSLGVIIKYYICMWYVTRSTNLVLAYGKRKKGKQPILYCKIVVPDSSVKMKLNPWSNLFFSEDKIVNSRFHWKTHWLLSPTNISYPKNCHYPETSQLNYKMISISQVDIPKKFFMLMHHILLFPRQPKKLSLFWKK